MRDLTDFTARLNAEFGAGHEARYNLIVGRYEIISPSADGKPTSQYWQWTRDPVTGLALEPHPDTGLLPYRELHVQDEETILENMRASFVGSPTEGRGSWRKQFRHRQALNSAKRQASVKARAESLVEMMLEMQVARRVAKFHAGSAVSRRVAYRV